MPTWTTLSTKTAGVDSISIADLQNLMGNIEFLRTRPTYRVLSLIDTIVTSATWTDIDFDDADASTDRHEEWDTDGLMDTTLISGNIEVGDVRAGNWLIGGRAGIARSLQRGGIGWRLVKNGSEAIGHVTDVRSIGNAAATKVSRATLQDFAATDDYEMQMQILADSTGIGDSDAFKLRGVEGPYRPSVWGMWMGDNTSNTDDYTDIGFTTQANAAVWWNDTIANLDRLYKRPACGKRAASNQASIGTTFTTVTLGTTEFNTDNMAGTADRITSNRDAYYWISCGVDAQPTTWTDVNRTALQIRLVRDLGGGGQVVLDAVENSVALWDVTSDEGPSLMHDSIIRVPSGSDIAMQVRIQPSSLQTPTGTVTLEGGGNTYLRMVEVSADVTATGRQYFTDVRGMPSNPTFTGKDWDYLPEGIMNAISRDYVSHLINPPVISIELEDEAQIQSSSNAGEITVNYEQIPFNFVLHDNWDLYDSDELPPSEISLPIDGVYLVCLRATFLTRGLYYLLNAPGDDDVREGDAGRRGIRIKQNRRTVAVNDRDPMLVGDSNHNMSCSGLIVGKAGDLIRGEAFADSFTEVSLGSNADSSIAGDARLSVVWLGDGVTWTRRADGSAP